jgi:hypothetical protein
MPAGTDNDSGAKAERLRHRAEEIRTAAVGMQSVPARTTMLHIAETYERLANHLDGQPGPVKDAG